MGKKEIEAAGKVDGALGGGLRSIKLAALLTAANIPGNWAGDVGEEEVAAIVTDSRNAGEGSLFVALPGIVANGHDFIDQAIAKGCTAVMMEMGHEHLKKKHSVPFIEVADSRLALACLAAEFRGRAADKMVLLGITGTNGKTTTSYLLESIIRAAGCNPGVIGTVNYRYNGHELPAPFTTPEPVMLHEMLHEMAAGGVTHVIMEVSSHALVQKRILGLQFDAVLFTNLSRDHLDYHGSMEEYFAAKKILFTEHLKEDGRAVITRDLPDRIGSGADWGEKMLRQLIAIMPPGSGQQVISCGLGKDNDIHPENYTCNLRGIEAYLHLPCGKARLQTTLVGEFNLKNILGAAALAAALDFSLESIESGLNALPAIPGRLERVSCDAGFDIYVDYAHTPDALENILNVLRQLRPTGIITVFGCGGDRDQGKRPLMGQVAGKLADLVIVTSDNSRSEPSDKIMAEIEQGLLAAGKEKIDIAIDAETDPEMRRQGYALIISRSEAIKTAIMAATAGDIVVIAGKGHENYQICSGRKIFFDDRQEARTQLLKINAGRAQKSVSRTEAQPELMIS